jgi:ferredoxin-NADP reductase
MVNRRQSTVDSKSTDNLTVNWLQRSVRRCPCVSIIAVALTLPIRDVTPATPRARILRIDLAGRTFPYRAGQALLVGRPGQDVRRPYSIAAAPEDAERDGWLELLVGTDDDGNAGAHLDLTVGAPVDVEGPIGRFTFPEAPEEQRFVFIAGGTGIAPLRAMLRHALHMPHRAIGLLYSARTPSDFAYESELRSLAAQGRIELRQTVTRDVAAQEWTGTRGRIGVGDLAPLVHGSATLCFICGPPSLVAQTAGLLDTLGIPRHRIRQEEWGTT